MSEKPKTQTLQLNVARIMTKVNGQGRDLSDPRNWDHAFAKRARIGFERQMAAEGGRTANIEAARLRALLIALEDALKEKEALLFRSYDA